MTIKSPRVGEQNIDWGRRFTPRLLNMEAFPDMTNIARNWVGLWVVFEQKNRREKKWVFVGLSPSSCHQIDEEEKTEGVYQAGKEGNDGRETMRCRVIPFHLLAEEQLWCVKLLEWVSVTAAIDPWRPVEMPRPCWWTVRWRMLSWWQPTPSETYQRWKIYQWNSETTFLQNHHLSNLLMYQYILCFGSWSS